MELTNVSWIFKNYFIAGVMRRWYVVLAALAGLWGTMELWTKEAREGIDYVLVIAVSAVGGFVLMLGLLFIFHVIATMVRWLKLKSTEAVCPECFADFPAQFSCECGKKRIVSVNEREAWVPTVKVPYISYLTRGLFLNHCWECGGEFFPRSNQESTLRGVCLSCGGMIKDWELHMLHTGKIVVSIEQSPGETVSPGFTGAWRTDSHHGRTEGVEHYTRKYGREVQHWLRWGPNLTPKNIPQNLTENIHYIWMDKESGTSAWQRTNTLLNHIRKDLKEITFGFGGSAEELNAGGLGILESEIIPDITLEDFIREKVSR